ncbi:uncharacterized protein LOC117334790 [Pecten maximus]|uniref:uncharacterized protein LOC117334790 n=1 Tax=Pecten maximus TaxID=6579 RepID=UPI001458FAB4|nr:uncharacterized protein LOC117334790 [Pecten maximus]
MLMPNFGENEKHRKGTISDLSSVLSTIREVPEIMEFWNQVLQFMKDLSLSSNSAKYPAIVEPFKYLFRSIPDKSVKKHPEIVNNWIPVFIEVLQKAPTTSLETWAYEAAETMACKCAVTKDSPTDWFKIVKGLLKCQNLEAALSAYRILYKENFMEIWNWKKHEKDAFEILDIIAKIDFPTEGKVKVMEEEEEEEDDEDYEEKEELSDEIWQHYADIIKTLQDQFGLAKISEKLVPAVAEILIKTMEKRSKFLNRYVYEIYQELEFEQQLTVVPGLIQRLVVLVLDREYPWDHTGFICCRNLLRKGLSSYSTGKEMPVDLNKAYIKVILFTMETKDLPYIVGLRSSETIYLEIATYIMETFISKHLQTGSHKAVNALVPALIKQRSHEVEQLQKSAISALKYVASTGPALLTPHLDTFIKWYQTSHSTDDLDLIQKPYKVSKGFTKEQFKVVLQAMMADQSETSKGMQSALILDMAEKQPQLFTQQDIDGMIQKYVDSKDSQYNTLLAFSKVLVKKPDLFGNNMIEHVLKNPNVDLAYAIDVIGVSLASHKKGMVKTIMKEFMNLSKRCQNTDDQITVINGARSLAVMQGTDLLEPYRSYFEDLQESGETLPLREMAILMLTALDGKDKGGINEDFKERLARLEAEMAETKDDVKDVKKDVDKQTRVIKTVKTDVINVKKNVKDVKKDLEETKIKVEEVDNKTMTNAPKWSRDLTKLMNPKTEHDWRLLAQRLGYTPQDIKGWATQHDPCMGLLSEWYATHKTIEATHAILNILQEMNRMDGAAIVENAMKAVEDVVEEEVDYATPPPIFLSYQWGHQNEVKLLRNHLLMAGYECWMDIGQMGGGDKLFEKIDNGIRGAKLIICCVSEKYAKSPNCNREVNLSVNLGKPMIPLLMEKMAWPPKGSMGPIFSEYLFVRFFQRGGEETDDQRYWPVPKFQELLMQLNMYKAMPDESIMSGEYKDWWVPVTEEIVITKKKDGGQSSQVQTTSQEEESSPDVFLSYQWGKQNQIKQLYRRLSELGYSCWMDIYQMGGGDSLYDKIDKGVRGCKVVLSCVTTKYALSANCRREVSLADSLKKPMVPLLLEKIDWPPTGPMSMVFTQLLFINFYRDETVQLTWVGDKFDELHTKIKENISPFAVENSKVVPSHAPKKEEQKEKVKPEGTNEQQQPMVPLQPQQQQMVAHQPVGKPVAPQPPPKQSSTCVVL